MLGHFIYIKEEAKKQPKKSVKSEKKAKKIVPGKLKSSKKAPQKKA